MFVSCLSDKRQPFSGTALLSNLRRGQKRFAEQSLLHLTCPQTVVDIIVGKRHYFATSNFIRCKIMNNFNIEHRTAIIEHELSCYNIDIVYLGKTRLPGAPHFEEKGACYTFYRTGKREDENCQTSVGFALTIRFVSFWECFQLILMTDS